jgi:hypothetical protein
MMEEKNQTETSNVAYAGKESEDPLAHLFEVLRTFLSDEKIHEMILDVEEKFFTLPGAQFLRLIVKLF